MTAHDTAPAAPEAVPATAQGTRRALPINEILCGRNEQMLATFPDDCIDLTVTSPPYDGLRAYKGYTWDFTATAAQLYRVTKPCGVVVWVVGDATINGSESGTSFRQALGFMEIGFRLHDTMIYASDKPPRTHNRYEQEFEYMFIFSKGTPKTFNPLMIPCKQAGRIPMATFQKTADGTRSTQNTIQPIKESKFRGNVWRYTTGMGGSTSDTYAFEHAAMFPEKLAEDHILSWSNPGDIVLDPFVGSGTTSKMTIRHHRQFIGIDISPEYCDLARRRIGCVQVTMELT